jgi:hypothetical protein
MAFFGDPWRLWRMKTVRGRLAPRAHRQLFPALLLVLGCSRAPSSSSSASSVERTSNPAPTVTAAPPKASQTEAPATGSAPPAPAASASAARPGQPLPPFGSVAKLLLRRDQGGPSVQRCGSVEYEVEVDMVASSWTQKLCHPDTKGPPGREPLTRTAGKLSPARRADVERVYRELRHEPARGCGKDGGTLSLSITPRAGKTERWVDDELVDHLGPGCTQPTAWTNSGCC